MTSITAVKSAYYNLLYARGNVEANATAYKLAEQLVSENVKRVQVGALAPLDEKQSESQAATSLAAMQVAQQALVVQENSLKSLLTDHYSEWAGVSLLPSEELIAIPQDLNLQESWRLAVTQRPELVEAKINVEKQNITLKYDFNQLFPELDLVGSYGRNAIADTVGDALDGIRQGNHSFYSYGAFVSIPLGGNISARNQRKADKATLKQLLLSLKQTEQNIVIQVDNDVGSVRSTLQQVHATHDARVYAEDALAAERKKLENGKSTSFIVLQLISNLTTAKVAEVQALANYNVAVAQLSLDEGSTLADNHIDLKLK
jgi:outer membrane protein TolC